MPAAGIHLCVAKTLLNKDMNQYLFFLGTIAPDSWRNSNSTKSGSHFQILEKIHYEKFYQKYKDKMNNPFIYGYLIHLITDYYWYGNSLSTVKTKYLNNELYQKEMKKLISMLMLFYDIKPLKQVENTFLCPVEELETSGINKTVEYVNNVSFENSEESLQLFDFQETILDINKTSRFIKDEIKLLERRFF